jgi:predicted acyl esterase
MTFVSTVMSLLLCTVAAIPPLQKPQSDSYSVQMHSVTVTSWDGTRLNARAAVPSTSNSSLRFPCVLMSNSWGIPDVQYANVQESWASQGYVVFEYEARGWYTSEGTVSLGNITDQKDVSAILDYLTQQASEWHIDTRAFASCGVSYGAGLAVLGAAHDSRIVTALSLSGWGNLSRAFDSAFGPNRIWANLLIGSGEATARLPPTLQEMWDRLNDNTQLDVVRTWANLRSPSAPDLLSQLAARRVPIFISNNFEDQERACHPTLSATRLC